MRRDLKWYLPVMIGGFVLISGCEPSLGNVMDQLLVPLNPTDGERCGHRRSDGCDLDNDGAFDGQDDCDDTDPDVQMRTWYLDEDGDGFGDARFPLEVCAVGTGFTEVSGDCDDTEGSIFPGSQELCSDGLDNDCDGEVDEPVPGSGATEWYLDADGDGFGTDATSITTCDQPVGYSSLDTDCDDDDSGHHPDAIERCDDTDWNCTLEPRDVDVDGDGYFDEACPPKVGQEALDCDDGDPSINPGMAEICENGRDDDCSGAVDDADEDGDLWISEACGGGDCDDTRADVNPGRDDVSAGDGDLGVDNNCDERIDEGDGCAEPMLEAEGLGIHSWNSTKYTSTFKTLPEGEDGLCPGAVENTTVLGPDLVFQFVLAAGDTLEANLNTSVDVSWNGVLWLMTDCEVPVCLQTADVYGPDRNVTESIVYAAEALQTVYLVVDGAEGVEGGNFTLDVAVLTSTQVHRVESPR